MGIKFNSLLLLIVVTFVSMVSLSASRNNATSSHQSEFLLLDARIIDKTENAKLTLGNVTKDSRNPLFKEDKPWEVRFDNLYANVLYDSAAGKYKCWYSPFIVDPGTSKIPVEQRKQIRYPAGRMGKREMGVCYAESDDGIHWRKPNLGIIEFNGSRENNIVMRAAHGAGVFRDEHETDSRRRYKMFFKRGKMKAAFSADGLHWGDAFDCKGLDVAGDTHNNALWVPTLNKYVGITRMWGGDPAVRQVGWTSTEDFSSWSEAKVVLQGLTPSQQTYAMPAFYYKGVYLGLVAIFNPETDRVCTELAWSPETIEWHRIAAGTPFIANSDTPHHYDWGCVYAAAYPIVQKDKILLYYGGSDGPHTGWRKGYFCLATIRKDGFAGYEPIDLQKPAAIISNPLTFVGKSISLCADVANNGQIIVTILDQSRQLLAQSEVIKSGLTDGKVQWRKISSLKKFAGKTVILKFEFLNAKLWSFEFD